HIAPRGLLSLPRPPQALAIGEHGFALLNGPEQAVVDVQMGVDEAAGQIDEKLSGGEELGFAVPRHRPLDPAGPIVKGRLESTHGPPTRGSPDRRCERHSPSPRTGRAG